MTTSVKLGPVNTKKFCTSSMCIQSSCLGGWGNLSTSSVAITLMQYRFKLLKSSELAMKGGVAGSLKCCGQTGAVPNVLSTSKLVVSATIRVVTVVEMATDVMVVPEIISSLSDLIDQNEWSGVAGGVDVLYSISLVIPGLMVNNVVTSTGEVLITSVCGPSLEPSVESPDGW